MLQYAAPLLYNSLSKISSMDMASIIERLMKLSTISLVVWLAGFFAAFQSALNALAEIMRFGDREVGNPLSFSDRHSTNDLLELGS